MRKKTIILKEILQIEAEIRKINQNKKYRIMQKVVNKLALMRGALITIPSPVTFDRQITLRKNTDDFIEILASRCLPECINTRFESRNSKFLTFRLPHSEIRLL